MIPLQLVLKTYNDNGVSFKDQLEYHLIHGIVFSDDKCFFLAIPSDLEYPETPVGVESANCMFISMCSGDMSYAMTKYEDTFDFIAFKREFKNSKYLRVYPYSQFQSKLK